GQVGGRYVLEARRSEGVVRGGEQSGHVMYLEGHVAGDGLAAAMLLCRALEGRSLSEAAAVMPRLPQAQENVRSESKDVPDAVLEEVARINEELGERGRVLVRPSGTEPVMRVLGEASSEEEAAALCASIEARVREHLG